MLILFVIVVFLNNAVDLNVTTKACGGMICESTYTKWDYKIEKAKLLYEIILFKGGSSTSKEADESVLSNLSTLPDQCKHCC